MIYITGATGFIGSRVAQLVARGERIRCLVRSTERAAQLKALGAELIEGPLNDVATHLRGLAGARAAIHIAAIYDVGIVDAEAIQRTNVEGTRAFLEAAKQAQTPLVVYISSTVAVGPSRSGLTEPRDAYEGPYPSVYHRTKAEAHKLARAAQQAGQPIVIICPAFVYGPGDEGPAGRFVEDLRKGKVPALLNAPAHFSYAYVEDVAQAIAAAVDRGKVGEVYVLSGENTDMNDFAERVAEMLNVRAPRLRLPVGLVRASSMLTDAISRRTGIRFPITREAVATTSVDRWVYTHERAARDLGYQPRPLNEGLKYLKDLKI